MTNPGPDKLKEIFATSLKLIQEGRVEEWIALFAPDGVLEFVYAPPGFPTVMRGTDQLRAQMSFMPQQLKVEYGEPVFHAVTPEGVLVAEFPGDCTLLATGGQYRQDYVSVVRFEDGLITHYRDFWNPWLPMAAVGGEEAWNQALQPLMG
ncbi:nuclear transport factor 2 family protein [Streptomyces sp. MUM 2J]|uniref:nuclear transport factor 2 family protein n=1 Tax=Streptomyces sp. MUM 2J TaxID=2791987 RepID=UPI001F04D2A6|nr:nuclear transport factor 2 family protein [Streptomyces sp. MUM 2J]MCH0567438.1 nuclear transport factor 2 family protein [Streptomyces sp. MUM 2J]